MAIDIDTRRSAVLPLYLHARDCQNCPCEEGVALLVKAEEALGRPLTEHDLASLMARPIRFARHPAKGEASTFWLVVSIVTFFSISAFYLWLERY